MLRFLFPAFTLACALLVLFAGAFSDHLRPFETAETADSTSHLPASAPDQTTAQSLPSAPQTVPADSQQQPQATEPQAAPQLLQRQVQTLQQKTTVLEEQLTRRSQELDQRTHELERRTRDLQVAQAAQAETNKFRLGSEPQGQLRQSDDGKQQPATRSDEVNHPAQALDQHQQPPEPRQGNPELAQAEADRLRQVIDALRQRSKAEDSNPARQKAEEQLPTRQQQQQAKPQQPVAKAQPQSTTPVSQPTQPDTGTTDAASPAQRLMTARQWLAAGRPDQARRLLAMVQTQLVLQPVTPDAPEARGTSLPAGDVGNAIRWLDLGANRQAMQAINQAIEDSNGPVSTVRAWSGYPIGIYSGYSQPYATGDQR
jgi:hypothetical protein